MRVQAIGLSHVCLRADDDGVGLVHVVAEAKSIISKR